MRISLDKYLSLDRIIFLLGRRLRGQIKYGAISLNNPLYYYFMIGPVTSGQIEDFILYIQEEMVRDHYKA